MTSNSSVFSILWPSRPEGKSERSKDMTPREKLLFEDLRVFGEGFAMEQVSLSSRLRRDRRRR